jgi:hypothetical protein
MLSRNGSREVGLVDDEICQEEKKDVVNRQNELIRRSVVFPGKTVSFAEHSGRCQYVHTIHSVSNQERRYSSSVAFSERQSTGM